MKKSNLYTLLFLCLSMIAVVVFTTIRHVKSVNADENTPVSSAKNSVENTIENIKITENLPDGKAESPEAELTEQKISEPKKLTIDEVLFIGDSRTVGLMEYAQLEKADFFCTVGMSVFNIHKNSVSIPGTGKVTLTELLDSKTYSAVYIMLGVNEMGYKYESILSKYAELIEFVKGKQSDAAIIIHANLHVTKSRSDSDKTFNNHAINQLNTALSEFADNKSIFYLDANVLFDDSNGALSADKSSDNTHLYAKYYEEWGNWIVQQTASLTKEE